jgi:hypothetical protein
MMKCQIQHHQSTSRQASIDCCRGSGSLLPGGLFTFGVSRVALTISQPSAAKRIGLNAEVCRPRTHLFQFGEILSRARRCNRREFAERQNAIGGADLSSEPQPACARRSISPTHVTASCQVKVSATWCSCAWARMPPARQPERTYCLMRNDEGNGVRHQAHCAPGRCDPVQVGTGKKQPADAHQRV